MDKKRILLLIVLSIFIVGMVMGAASAGYTFKDDGYKYKMKSPELKKMKKSAKKDGVAMKYRTVTKINKKYRSHEQFKVGKKYRNMIDESKFKILKVVKVHKAKGVGDGYYVYKVRQYTRMLCEVDYDDGWYSYFAAV